MVAQASAPPPSALSFPIGTTLEEVENRLIRETLKSTNGDKSLAAQLLGISTRTIYRKLGETDSVSGESRWLGTRELAGPDDQPLAACQFGILSVWSGARLASLASDSVGRRSENQKSCE